MEAIHEAVEYKPGSSDIETTAEEALEAKSGVCQDHAHIFIAAARAMRIPARYVSGYLLMETVEQTATHAWAEAICPGSAGSASIRPIAYARTSATCASPPALAIGMPHRFRGCASGDRENN